MKPVTSLLFLCLLAGSIFAQTKKDPSLADMQRQMLEMQRQLMQQLQQMTPGGNSSEFKWDTTFSFRFDTIFGGNGMGSKFFFSPFGQDSAAMRDFWDAPPTMDWNPFGEDFDWAKPPAFGAPENDENSAIDAPDDGLLPEERLRQQENGGTKPADKQPQPASKKPKIKTIRI